MNPATRPGCGAGLALRAEQALIALMHDAGDAGVLEFRFRADELVCSAGMARLLGLAPRQMHGRLRDWLVAVLPADRARVRTRLAAHLTLRNTCADLDFRVAGLPAGAPRWLSLRLRLSYLHNGRPAQMVGMAVDVTPKKRRTRCHPAAVDRRSAGRAAQGTIQVQDHFLTMMGQELRSPRGALTCAAEAMRGGAGGPAMARRAADRVLGHTYRLVRVLDALKDVADAADGGTVRALVPPDPAPPEALRAALMATFARWSRPQAPRGSSPAASQARAKRRGHPQRGAACLGSRSALGRAVMACLPLVRPAAGTAQSGVRAMDRALRRVVLIDVHADLCEAVAAVLSLQSHAVPGTACGQTRLALLLAEWPDVAIIDVSQPRLDGLQLARQARAAGYGGRMIAMSGDAQARAVQQARHAGFDAYLVQPVSPQALHAALDVRIEGFGP